MGSRVVEYSSSDEDEQGGDSVSKASDCNTDTYSSSGRDYFSLFDTDSDEDVGEVECVATSAASDVPSEPEKELPQCEVRKPLADRKRGVKQQQGRGLNIKKRTPGYYFSQPSTVSSDVCKVRSAATASSGWSESVKDISPSNSPHFHQLQYLHSAHSGAVVDMHWLDADTFLSASMERRVRVWRVNYRSTRLAHTNTVDTASPVRRCDVSASAAHYALGTFDGSVIVYDVTSQAVRTTFTTGSGVVTALRWHPASDFLCLSGGRNAISLWDVRVGGGTAVQCYKRLCGEVRDVLFLPRDGTVYTPAVDAGHDDAAVAADVGEHRFVSCGDAVGEDTDNKNLMVWDLRSGAALSSQLYREKFTCGCLRNVPAAYGKHGAEFAGHFSAGYVALFSSHKPYRLNKYKRFEQPHGQSCDGYAIQCDFHPTRPMLASGSSTGNVYLYDFHSCQLLTTLNAPALCNKGTQAMNCVTWTNGRRLLSADWGGNIYIWTHHPVSTLH